MLWQGSLTAFQKLISWRALRSWRNVPTNVLIKEECILKNKNKSCPYKKLSVFYNSCLKTFGSHLVCLHVKYTLLLNFTHRLMHFFIHGVQKRLYPFFIFFSRCPVCGEWCKLHWLLLDTHSFDWNTRLSRGHKMLKMAPTKQQKAFCAVEYAKTTSGAFAFA